MWLTDYVTIKLLTFAITLLYIWNLQIEQKVESIIYAKKTIIMITNVLTITLYFSCTVILFLMIAKLNIFSRQRNEHTYHVMCLLYFPGFDIMVTSDSRQKRDKKLQNRLTRYLFVLSTYVILVINFLN